MKGWVGNVFPPLGFPLMPIRPRTRTAQSRLRDDEVLDAAVLEARDRGLDALGMHAVARRLGLSAGAVYSRHETVGELMVAMWQQRCSEPVVRLIGAVNRAAGLGETGTVDAWIVGDPTLTVGIEMIAIAHRYPELAEVLIPDVDAALDWSTLSDVDRARVAFLLGFVIGRSIYSGVDEVSEDLWRGVLMFLLPATRVEPMSLEAGWRPQLGREVLAETGEPLRDALVNAASTVIGSVGLEAATNSRISRRAGLTPGAVYTLYSTKDELLVDAIRILLDDAIRDNDPIAFRAGDRSQMGEVSAHLLSRGGGEARRPWLRFRLEAYIAALHRPHLAAVLADIHAVGRARYDDMLNSTGLAPNLIALVALVGQSIPLGLAVLDRYIDGLENVDYRPVTIPLLSSVARLAE